MVGSHVPEAQIVTLPLRLPSKIVSLNIDNNPKKLQLRSEKFLSIQENDNVHLYVKYFF